MSLTLVIGGTRSGKSAHAERLALGFGGPVRYVATADPDDESMTERIRAHAARRMPEWQTVVAGDDLAGRVNGVTVIDGLGAWIGGVLHRATADVAAEVERLIAAARDADVIVVAEEAGQGMLPLDSLARQWLDLLGESVQRLSDAAERVDYVVAGRPLTLTAPVCTELGALRRHGDRDVRPGDADHAVNILAGGPPAWLQTALAAALDGDAERYPDDTQARAATAARHNRDPDEIVVTNGATEALWLLGPALRPRLAACVHPGFTEAEVALRLNGNPVVRVLRDPNRDFALEPRDVPDAADLAPTPAAIATPTAIATTSSTGTPAYLHTRRSAWLERGERARVAALWPHSSGGRTRVWGMAVRIRTSWCSAARVEAVGGGV